MLNYQSVRSSEPQIRSNPALRQLGLKSGFQTKLTSLLESTPLPFPTFQLLKEASKPVLTTQQHYAWIRPSHLRSVWLVLADGFPALLYDPKHMDRISSLRISFDMRQVQVIGPIVCEVAWDAQDHILWIFDVAIWEKQVIWGHVPYSKRWSYIQTLFGSILDPGHPMSDAEIKLPNWISLAELASLSSLDPAMSVEFQPEKAGQRRQLYLVKDDGIRFKPVSHHERKMVAEAKPKEAKPKEAKPKEAKPRTTVPKHQALPSCSIVLDEPSDPVQDQTHIQKPKEDKKEWQTNEHTQSITCILSKDKTSKAPDTYQLFSFFGESLGLAAIRSLEISKQLRTSLTSKESLQVKVQWYEPFQKYQVKEILPTN